ncbi:NADH-quinone oxidoreductase subunit NuoE [Streptacidiphilus sp. ASG 303]|uniref:NADH-quinone oxidoreductase subunit NuoE n=1 Tax=Streptacidiphilus sp. ASG 303 TaxID=2896847 RepID=UPI001E4F65D8|nr:NADH-quinone oxidoreductase subunit NuoE [Streptacidiphilus sp. ASG 303]MCD0485322.1 NADH-quinone oxidoreductase subunit NuoE [Streptacidiphilus sp. ASG 303]
MPALPAPDYPADVRARLDADAKELIGRYPVARSALLPLLHLVQSEEGWVSPTGIRFCAEQLGLTTAEVTAVATFYTMYRRRPAGKYHVGVCTNTLCAVLGGDQIFAELKEHLGIENNETTEDGAVSIEHIECNAACDYAPVMTVNWEFFDNQTPESAKRLVDDLRAGHTVLPTRGAALCTFRETSRILAGFPDERPGALDASGAGGAPSLAGLRLARGETLPGGGAARVVSPRHQDGADAAPGGPSQGAPSAHDAPAETAASDPHRTGDAAGPAEPEGGEDR